MQCGISGGPKAAPHEFDDAENVGTYSWLNESESNSSGARNPTNADKVDQRRTSSKVPHPEGRHDEHERSNPVGSPDDPDELPHSEFRSPESPKQPDRKQQDATDHITKGDPLDSPRQPRDKG